jgi:hypothetical protein
MATTPVLKNLVILSEMLVTDFWVLTCRHTMVRLALRIESCIMSYYFVVQNHLFCTCFLILGCSVIPVSLKYGSESNSLFTV